MTWILKWIINDQDNYPYLGDHRVWRREQRKAVRFSSLADARKEVAFWGDRFQTRPIVIRLIPKVPS